MYIKLPKKFNMDSSTTKNAAFIQNKVLKIRRGTTVREVMYEITFIVVKYFQKIKLQLTIFFRKILVDQQ